MSYNNGWAFPSIDGVIDEQTFDKNIEKSEKRDERDKKMIELENELNQKNEEIIRLNNRVKLLENQHSESEHRLITLTEKIHQIVPEIKLQLTQLVIEMVKKVSKKVLKHELASNHEVMTALIKVYMDEFEKNELIEIEVSEEDYSKLNHIQFDTKAKWSVNTDLKSGDMIVNSQLSAIRLVINDVIENMTSE